MSYDEEVREESEPGYDKHEDHVVVETALLQSVKNAFRGGVPNDVEGENVYDPGYDVEVEPEIEVNFPSRFRVVEHPAEEGDEERNR